MTFSEKLVKLRKIKGLTQDEFASAVGVSRQSVYKWESAQSYPEAAKLVEIKKLFGISIDDLLDDSYEVVIPEKPKKKKLTKADKKRIEAEVEREEGIEVPEEEESVAQAVEEPAEEPKTAEPVAEEPVKEEPKEQEEAESPKKRGFFARLFGIK